MNWNAGKTNLTSNDNKLKEQCCTHVVHLNKHCWS